MSGVKPDWQSVTLFLVVAAEGELRIQLSTLPHIIPGFHYHCQRVKLDLTIYIAPTRGFSAAAKLQNGYAGSLHQRLTREAFVFVTELTMTLCPAKFPVLSQGRTS